MEWQALADHLFGPLHQIRADGDFLHGEAGFEGATLEVVGSTRNAPVGVELALRQARVVLDVLSRHPGRAILLLIDTQGQALRRRDELLGINRAMAHLGCCIDLARRRGHRTLGLVYDQALSGGFITSGLIADACHALPEAEIRVMRLPAMARVTKLSQARLEELSQGNPVFAPGVENYVAMGGIAALWGQARAAEGAAEGVAESAAQGAAEGAGDGGVAVGDRLRAGLSDALRDAPTTDERARLGEVRGGRRLAAAIARRVLEAP